MSSRRQSIVDAIKARFAGITSANGYQTDVGAHVKEWQVTALEGEELPAAIISDPREKALIDNKNSGSFTRQLTIIVSMVFDESTITPEEARKALADANKAIGVDPRWSGLATRSLPDTEEVIVDPQSKKLGGARVTFIVEYQRKAWD